MGHRAVNVELTPRHLQLRELLLRRWKTKGLKAGDKIESQNEITKFCDFSLITVIKTLKDLEAEGVIRTGDAVTIWIPPQWIYAHA